MVPNPLRIYTEAATDLAEYTPNLSRMCHELIPIIKGDAFSTAAIIRSLDVKAHTHIRMPRQKDQESTAGRGRGRGKKKEEGKSKKEEEEGLISIPTPSRSYPNIYKYATDIHD